MAFPEGYQTSVLKIYDFAAGSLVCCKLQLNDHVNGVDNKAGHHSDDDLLDNRLLNAEFIIRARRGLVTRGMSPRGGSSANSSELWLFGATPESCAEALNHDVPLQKGAVCRLSDEVHVTVMLVDTISLVALIEELASLTKEHAALLESPATALQRDTPLPVLKRLFYHALYGRISQRLAISHGLAPLYLSDLRSTHGENRGLTYLPFKTFAEPSLVVDVEIDVQRSGLVLVCQKCSRLGSRDSNHWLSRYAKLPASDGQVLLLPGSSYGHIVATETPGLTSPSFDDRKQGNNVKGIQSIEVILWRRLVLKWLESCGISLPDLDERSSWSRVRLQRRDWLLDGVEVPPVAVVEWPMALCYSIIPRGVNTTLVINSLNGRQAPQHRQNSNIIDQMDLSDVAVQWAKDKPEPSTFHGALLMEHKTLQADDFRAKERFRDLFANWQQDEGLQGQESGNASHETSGIYPTPPDANSFPIAASQVPLGSRGTIAAGSTSQTPHAQTETQSEAVEVNGVFAHASQGFKSLSPVRQGNMEELMYDAVEDDELHQDHITDADFSFFDESNIMNHVEQAEAPGEAPFHAMTESAAISPSDSSKATMALSRNEVKGGPTGTQSPVSQRESNLEQDGAPRMQPAEPMVTSDLTQRQSAGGSARRPPELSDQKYQANGRFFSDFTSQDEGTISTPSRKGQATTFFPAAVSQPPHHIRLDLMNLRPTSSSTSSDNESDDRGNTHDYNAASSLDRGDTSAISTTFYHGSRPRARRSNADASTLDTNQVAFVRAAKDVLSSILSLHDGLPVVAGKDNAPNRSPQANDVEAAELLSPKDFIIVAQHVAEQSICLQMLQLVKHKAPAFERTISLPRLSTHILGSLARDFRIASIQRVEELCSSGAPASDGEEASPYLSASPRVAVRRNDAAYTISPAALPFWDTIGLEPANGPKDVVAFCLYFPSITTRAQAKGFMQSMRRVYEGRKLGIHKLGTSGDAMDNCLFACGRSEGSSDAFETARLLKFFLTIGSLGAKAANKAPTAIVYILAPSSATLTRKLCTCFFKALSSRERSSKSKPWPQFVLQICSTSNNWILDDPLNFERDSLIVMTNNVYDRIPTSRWRDGIPGPFYSPAVELVSSVPERISFGLSEDPSSYLLHKNVAVHLGYSNSLDGLWLTAAWIDEYGKRDMMRTFCLNGGVLITDVINELWATTVEYTSHQTAGWKVLVAKVGGMSADEALAWQNAQRATNTTKGFSFGLEIYTVDPAPPISFLPELAPPSTSSLPTSTHATPQATTYQHNYGTPPISTPPQFQINSPTAVASTPSAEQSGQPADGDSNSLLIDVTDETWGIAFEETSASHPSARSEGGRVMATGFLVKRGGPGDLEEPILMQARLLSPLDEDVGNEHHTERNRAVERLRNTLQKYRGLSLLARIRGVTDRVKGILPWHLAVTLTAVDNLSKTMSLSMIQDDDENGEEEPEIIDLS